MGSLESKDEPQQQSEVVRAALRRMSGLKEDKTQDESFCREDLKELFDVVAAEAQPKNKIDEAQFKKLCEALGLGLSDIDLQRVWRQLDKDDEGFLVSSEFHRGVNRRRLLRRVVSIYERKREEQHVFQVPENYDFSKSTTENYAAEADDDSEFAAQRGLLDYSYHSHYTKERVQWQDAMIASIVTETLEEAQAEPWVVYTCGPMGAGKGYVLHWLSEKGYFPLENIVHVDPDRFKTMMPEWSGYLSHDESSAGSLCHRESGFLAELAQHVAMARRQNLWVDGSLRNAKYYKQEFMSLRERHPEYRFAIFYVSARPEVALERIKKRARRTGRDVSESLFKASIEGSAESLRTLVPFVDFLARLKNDSDDKDPILEAFETVDRSGDFQSIQRRFAQSEPANDAFKRFPFERGAARLRILEKPSLQPPSKFFVLTMDASSRKRAAVPPEAVFFTYLETDGLAYFDLQQTLLRVVAFCESDLDLSQEVLFTLRFETPLTLPPAAALHFRTRWRPLPLGHKARAKDATAHCWIEPFELIQGTRYTRCGGQLFLISPQLQQGGNNSQTLFLFPIRGAD